MSGTKSSVVVHRDCQRGRFGGGGGGLVHPPPHRHIGPEARSVTQTEKRPCQGVAGCPVLDPGRGPCLRRSYASHSRGLTGGGGTGALRKAAGGGATAVRRAAADVLLSARLSGTHGHWWTVRPSLRRSLARRARTHPPPPPPHTHTCEGPNKRPPLQSGDAHATGTAGLSALGTPREAKEQSKQHNSKKQ